MFRKIIIIGLLCLLSSGVAWAEDKTHYLVPNRVLEERELRTLTQGVGRYTYLDAYYQCLMNCQDSNRNKMCHERCKHLIPKDAEIGWIQKKDGYIEFCPWVIECVPIEQAAKRMNEGWEAIGGPIERQSIQVTVDRKIVAEELNRISEAASQMKRDVVLYMKKRVCPKEGE